MLNKKIKGLLFIFLILFLISAVNAESIDDNLNIENIKISNIESPDYVATIDDENNFVSLNQTIKDGGSTVSLTTDYTYSEDTDSAFKTTGIIINKNITINGQGHTINGNHVARIFQVTSSGILTLKNINLINGYTDSTGGAVYNNNGVLTVINTTFINNTAKNQGGAIFTNKGVDVINSTFTNNTQTANLTSYGGAAIYSSSKGNVNVTNSTFDNNNGYNGGVIYCNSGLVTLINSNFTNNVARSNGGVVYGTKGVNVTNSIFEKNSAATSGGAIYSSVGMNIIGSTFEENSAKSGSAVYGNKGMNITNSRFDNNTASNYGAVYNGGDSITVVNSNFTGNTAGTGGAIYNTAKGFVTVINSTFTQNSVTNFGGAIHSTSNGFVKVYNSTFVNNYAKNYGGAISTKTNVTVVNSIFSDNAASSGGAIYTDDKGLMNVTDSRFNNNTATNGGAIYGKDCNVTITNSEFSNNTAANGGAIYYTERYAPDISLTVKNSNFDENHGLGDDIYTEYNTTVLGNNYTKNSYGNIYVKDIIIDGTIVSVLGNSTYYGVLGTTFKINATAFVDGASVQGYNITLTDGKNVYNTSYVGYGVYEITEGIFADFKIRQYAATIYNRADDPSYIVKNGTVINNKQNITIEVVVDEAVHGQNITGNITLRNADGTIADITGNVTVEINNKTYTVTVVNGTGKFNIDDELAAGNHTLKAKFDGNEEYNPANATVGFEVKSGEPNLEAYNLTKYYRDDGKFVIILTDSEGNPLANETITITINGVTYVKKTNSNGQILMNITLIPGVYNAEVSYGNITRNATLTIITPIEASDLIKYYLNGTQYYATFYDLNGNPLANANVTFSINGIVYTRTTDENGTAKLNINLYPGKYIITATNPLSNQTHSSNVTVLTTISGSDLVKYYRNGTQYYAVCLDLNGNPLANRNVTFYVHGVYYNRTTDENGVAKLNINLNPGEYLITAINPVNNETCSNMINVLTVVESEDLEMTASEKKPFKVTILGEQGKPLANAKVSFNIHGIFYHETTDANGVISLNLNLVAGKYIITSMYNDYKVSNTIIVK